MSKDFSKKTKPNLELRLETIWRQFKPIYLIYMLCIGVRMLLNQGFLAKVTLIYYSHSTVAGGLLVIS